MAELEVLDEETTVNSTELALVLGLTQRRVEQLTGDGTIPRAGRGKILLTAGVQAYIKFLNRNAPTEEDLKIEAGKRKAEALIKPSKARVAKAEADELDGKMHRSDDVAAMTEDLIYTIRAALMALPGRLAVDVAACSTPAEASEVLRKEIYTVMHELAQYEYDPRKYAERVRDRLNWGTDHGGDDDG